MNNIQVDAYVLDNKLKETIDYVQGTNALGISFHFLDYDIPSGATAKVYAAKPSTKAVYNTAAISGNDVNVDVTDQMFSEVGLTKLQVQIVKGDDTLVTFVQPVRVQKNYVAGDVPESENESNFIDDYLEDIKDATNNANTATDKANTAAGRAEDALEAIEGAVEGTLINDETPSKVTVYSGDKVEHLANLFDFSVSSFVRASGKITGDSVTMQVTSISSYAYLRVRKRLKKNTFYTVSWKSERSGTNGGGIRVYGNSSDTSTSDIFISSKTDTLNGSIVFDTGDSENIDFWLICGTTNSQIGDTVTFDGVLLIEGPYNFDSPTPILNSVMDVTKLLLDERTNAANLFNFDDLVLSRASIKIDGSKLTITSTNVSGSQRVAKDFKNILKSNTYYTISIKSTRTGNYGGGFLVEREENGQYISVLSKSNVLNSFGTFNTGDLGTCTAFRIYLYSGNNASSIGDTATFELMLIEGTQYTPANLHNVKDLARLTATVDNRTAINLFDTNNLKTISASVEIIDTGIKVISAGTSSSQCAYKDFDNLKKNTNYTISAKSARTGSTGGGIHVGYTNDGVFTSVLNMENTINPVATINTGDNDALRIGFYSGRAGATVGDTATFTDIMLVEGDFAPGGYVPSIGADNFSQAIADTKETLAETGTELTAAQGDITELQSAVSDLDNEPKQRVVMLYSNDAGAGKGTTITLSDNARNYNFISFVFDVNANRATQAMSGGINTLRAAQLSPTSSGNLGSTAIWGELDATGKKIEIKDCFYITHLNNGAHSETQQAKVVSVYGYY